MKLEHQAGIARVTIEIDDTVLFSEIDPSKLEYVAAVLLYDLDSSTKSLAQFLDAIFKMGPLLMVMLVELRSKYVELSQLALEYMLTGRPAVDVASEYFRVKEEDSQLDNSSFADFINGMDFPSDEK